MAVEESGVAEVVLEGGVDEGWFAGAEEAGDGGVEVAVGYLALGPGRRPGLKSVRPRGQARAQLFDRKHSTIVDLHAGRRARERPVSNSFNPEVNADPRTGLFITP
jgi:hypothetical protein